MSVRWSLLGALLLPLVVMAQEPSIFYAAMANDLGAARYYVEAGQPVDIKDKFGRTPLMLAAERGSVEVIRLLLKAGADPSVTTKEGLTAASFAWSPEVRQILMQASGKR